MSTENPDDTITIPDDSAAALAAGFDEDSTALPPSDDEDEAGGERAGAEGGEPAQESTPEYVQVTRQQLEELQARAAEIQEIKATQDRSFGTFGRTIQALEKRIAAPQGKRIEIEQSEIDELRKDGFETHAKALEKLRELQVVVGASAEDIERTVNDRVTEGVTKFKQQLESRMLRRVHPDWEQYQANPEFAEWVKAQPEDYRQRLQTASDEWDSDVIAEAMTKAKAAAKAAAEAKSSSNRQPQARAQARSTVLEAAIQPRGNGRPAQQGSRTAIEAMSAGFDED